MKLYQDNGNFSPNAKRARAMCYEVGVPVELVSMDFMKGEWKKPEYLAINPMGKVPTLVDDGYVLWESPAILCYLAEKFPEKKLSPTDPRGRAEVMRWMFWNASHLEPQVFGVGFEKLLKPMMNLEPDPVRIDAYTKDFNRFAPVLDKALEGKPWVLGDLSIVDFDIAPTIEFAFLSGMDDVKKYPRVCDWFERFTSREAWKKANAK
jgi:glutathione S-transferase